MVELNHLRIMALEAGLRRRLRGRVRGLHLQHVRGGVRITGQAQSYYAKQMAQEALRGQHLRVVDNALQVVWPEPDHWPAVPRPEA